MNIVVTLFDKNHDVFLLVGRSSLVFIYFIGGFSLLSGQIPIDYAASKGMPAAMVWIGYAIKLFAGSAVIIGLLTRLAALGLIIFTLTTAFVFHPYPDPIFLKELSMIGGLVLLMSVGAGKYSIDYFVSKRLKSRG